MNSTTVTVQQIHKQIQQLPQESLPELARYIEFLRFSARTSATAQPVAPLRIVELKGLLKGYDFSPAFLAEMRREMWKKLETVQP